MWNWKLRKTHSLSEINRSRLYHLSLHGIEMTGKMAFFSRLKKLHMFTYYIFLLIYILLSLHVSLYDHMHPFFVLKCIFHFSSIPTLSKISSVAYEINLKFSLNWSINRKVSIMSTFGYSKDVFLPGEHNSEEIFTILKTLKMAISECIKSTSYH